MGGGRAADVDVAGTRVEIGGTVLHSSGRYTMELMALTGAKEGESGLSIDDIVEAIVNNMYNQGAELNAFAGEVGLAGAIEVEAVAGHNVGTLAARYLRGGSD